MQIVIPTHGRAKKQTTLNAFPENMRPHILLVCSTKEDEKILRESHDNVRRAPVNSIADKRQWIMDNVKADKIFMLDDDMGFYGRCPEGYRTYNGRWKLGGVSGQADYLLAKGYATPKAIECCFINLSIALNTYAHVGLGSRMGNDVIEESWRENSRMMHAIGYDRKIFKDNKLKFNAVKFREDFHVTLSLLRQGYANTVYHDLIVAPGSYGAPGGCSGERSVDASNAEALKLAALHPGLVKVVDKEYKGVPRKEVIVQWRKAYGYDHKA